MVETTKLGIIQLWFNYFAISLFKAFGIHVSSEDKERNAPVFSAFMGMVTPVYQSLNFKGTHTK